MWMQKRRRGILLRRITHVSLHITVNLFTSNREEMFSYSYESVAALMIQAEADPAFGNLCISVHEARRFELRVQLHIVRLNDMEITLFHGR